MREAREIAEIDESDVKKTSSSVKSHDEILDLLKEIESIEEKISDPELIEEIPIEPEVEKKDIPQFIEVTEEPEGKKSRFKFLSELSKKKKLKEPKKKRFFKFRKVNEIQETIIMTNKKLA